MLATNSCKLNFKLNLKDKKMAFTNIKTSQREFLIEYLRGTGRELTQPQAEALFGIQNLRARMSEVRDMGLRVRVRATQNGRIAYSVCARDVNGSRARVAA
jgi:hypothetical protein